jgi:hypothetical protein
MFIYIIAIAWTYVVLLMSATEPSFIAGMMTFIFYCALPLSISIYLLGTPQRKKRRKSTLQSQISMPISMVSEIEETKNTSPNNNIRENT